MKRRDFLKDGSGSLLALSLIRFLPGILLAPKGMAEPAVKVPPNTNWADPNLGTKASASSYIADPPGGYGPDNVFWDDVCTGWQSNGETVGAWLELKFSELRDVSEVWLFTEPLPTDIIGQDIYKMTYPRVGKRAAPRAVRITVSSGASYMATLLPHADYYQIISIPKVERTSFVRVTIEDVWPKPGATETCIAKIRAFPQKHPASFEIAVHEMYDVQNGGAVQAATLNIVNPGEAVQAGALQVFTKGSLMMSSALQALPAHASFKQSVWIPAPFEDSEMEFEAGSPSGQLGCRQTLQVPKYHSYFDGGTFEIISTNHNDLGWLNTQEKTADYRSSDQILPALKMMREYPEFEYSMECTAYLMEFLERHPEKREEMAEFMRQQRFTWGASYVNLLQLSAGPERLVRQFYFGRRWLKNTFPGSDTHFYIQTDPPSMSLQMPQILAKAGIKYCLLGRLPFGFYNWRSPDGSSVVTRGFRYVWDMLDPKDNSGWLRFAAEREGYFASNQLPRRFIYDYTIDYLPPQPEVVPYVRRQNESMKRFASVWNAHFASEKSLQVRPPQISFTTPEESLDRFTAEPVTLTSLYGDWPLGWAYYDEPSNREALLNGRHAHNDLLAAERLYAGLSQRMGFADYPEQTFEAAWKANIWPDHGWGGNLGLVTDRVYTESYAKSRNLARELTSRLTSKLVSDLPRKSHSQIPVAVYNSLSWKRTDLVECSVRIPDKWPGWMLVDEMGTEVPCELSEETDTPGTCKIAFVAREVPAVGYRTFFLQPASTQPARESQVTGDAMENDFLKVTFGPGGIKSLYDKRTQREVLRTEKFAGGEVLQFTAPGLPLEDRENVSMQDFDRTSAHEFRFTRFAKSAIGVTAIREAHFSDFVLREYFHLYHELDRLDVEIEILNWNGRKDRELRVAFPINLDEARLSYEVPFGTVEMGKDDLDFSELPSKQDSSFVSENYGGDHALTFREAINWIDASSPNFFSTGCLAASDMTVHVFRDETDHPVPYPVLQHVLLSTRKALAWNPDYWYTQEGNHRYRMALLPHAGGWRARYRDGIGFNYRLLACVGNEGDSTQGASLPASDSFLHLDPPSLVLTAMKKSEDDDRIIIRFYEAEGNKSVAHIRLAVPIRHAWKTSLIEEQQEAITPRDDGTLELAVGPWEIVTLKMER
jgi:alpha-mannosidase